MPFQTSISRQHVMSLNSQTVVRKALADLATQTRAKAAPVVGNPLVSGRVLFSSAVDLGFTSVGFGLFSLANSDENIPVIWKKEAIDNVEWLVAYTTDDDDIVRDVTSAQKMADQGFRKGDRVTETSTSGVGVGGTVMSDARVGIDKRVSVLWDGNSQSTSVDPATLSNETAQHAIPPDQMTYASQKTASVNAALHAIAEPKPPKNAPPIAPGVVTKNLTMDQSGQGGKATVTVDFNDPQKGEAFFKQIEDLTGGVGGGASEPAEQQKPEEGAAASEQSPEEAQLGGEGKTPPPPAPPIPTPAGGGAPAPMASTIKNLTHFGSKVVFVTMEKFADFPPVFSYVNEDGKKIRLPLPAKVKLGTTVTRPDTQEKIRIGGYTVVEVESDDNAVIASLVGQAVDIADQVQPMGWTNSKSQNENNEGRGQPLPPNPALQQGAPPTADTSTPPAYDSQTADEAGTKQKFNMSVNPNDNSVTVKFEKAPALDAIDQAVQGQQSPMNAPVPGTPPPTPPPSEQQQPLGGQPKSDFSESESPVSF